MKTFPLAARFPSTFRSLALLSLASGLGALPAFADVPTLLSYQGHVTDVSGTPIGNTSPVNRLVTFKLYTAATGGTPIYAETQTVTLSGGNFSVLVGNGTGVSGLPGPSAPAPTPYAILSDLFSGTRYLGITVDDGTSAADAEITPRQQIVSAAYAFRAKVADSVANNALSTAMLVDSSVTTAKIGSAQVTTVKILDANVTTSKIADANITAAKIDTSTIGLWTPTGTGVYRPAGNVGIGVSAPAYPLTLPNVLGDKIGLWGNGGDHYGIGIQSGLFQLYTANNVSDVAFGYGASANFTETMRIRGNGNLGLGTTAPSEKLHVNGGNLLVQSSSAPAVRVSTGPATADLGIATSPGNYSTSAAANDTVLRATGKLLLQSGSGTAALSIETSNHVGIAGNLGIGRTDPAFPLTFADTLGDKISLFGNTSAHYGFGIQSNLFQIYTSTANADIAFGYGSSSSLTELMRVKGDGRVTIGTTDTLGRLNVGSMTASWDYFGYLNTDGGHDSNGRRNNDQLSIWATGNILAPNFWVSSDARLKTALSPTDSASDLKTLTQIEITNYELKDRSSGSPAQKKAIAQQVEKIFPQAVTQRTGTIPDIYRHAEVRTGWVQLATDLVAGDRVRVITPEGDSVRAVLEASPAAFRLDLPAEATDVFIYGRQVADLKSIDYDALSMLNVSATQELNRKVVKLETELATKDAQISSLEARLKALEQLLTGSR